MLCIFAQKSGILFFYILILMRSSWCHFRDYGQIRPRNCFNLLHKCQKLQPEIVATFISWYKLINNTYRHDLMFLNLKLTVLWVT